MDARARHRPVFPACITGTSDFRRCNPNPGLAANTPTGTFRPASSRPKHDTVTAGPPTSGARLGTAKRTRTPCAGLVRRVSVNGLLPTTMTQEPFVLRDLRARMRAAVNRQAFSSPRPLCATRAHDNLLVGVKPCWRISGNDHSQKCGDYPESVMCTQVTPPERRNEALC